MFPNSMILGMEIRVKVSQYVIERIKALRANQLDCYSNIACIRTNAIKYLPNFFKKGQVNIPTLLMIIENNYLFAKKK